MDKPGAADDQAVEAGARPSTRLGLLAGVVCFGWLVLTLFTMLRSANPGFGPFEGSAQHLLVGVVLSITLAGVAALRVTRDPAVLGWIVVVVTSAALLVFELLQLAVPVRSFQWSDLSFGITGAVIGTGIVAMASAKWPHFIEAAVMVGAVGLVATGAAVIGLPSDGLGQDHGDRLAACADTSGVGSAVDWDLAVLTLAEGGDGCVVAGSIPLVPFGASIVSGTDAEPTSASASASDDGSGGTVPDGDGDSTGVVLAGGGLISAALPGLSSEFRLSGEMTFGVRFTSTVFTEDTVPVPLVRLVIDDDPNRPLTQLLQRGPHLAVSAGSGRPVVGRGLTLVDQAEPGTIQELVLTYRSGTASAYLNGQLVGSEHGASFPLEPDGELSLEVGWRTDERWEPFDGRILAVAVGTTAADDDTIRTLFSTR